MWIILIVLYFKIFQCECESDRYCVVLYLYECCDIYGIRLDKLHLCVYFAFKVIFE